MTGWRLWDPIHPCDRAETSTGPEDASSHLCSFLILEPRAALSYPAAHGHKRLLYSSSPTMPVVPPERLQHPPRPLPPGTAGNPCAVCVRICPTLGEFPRIWLCQAHRPLHQHSWHKGAVGQLPAQCTINRGAPLNSPALWGPDTSALQ